MKTFVVVCFSWGLLFCGLCEQVLGQVHVRGYTRKDGTYVSSYVRSRPDGNFYNNWSTVGNVNPYTGKRGTHRTPPAGYGSSRGRSSNTDSGYSNPYNYGGGSYGYGTSGRTSDIDSLIPSRVAWTPESARDVGNGNYRGPSHKPWEHSYSEYLQSDSYAARRERVAYEIAASQQKEASKSEFTMIGEQFENLPDPDSPDYQAACDRVLADVERYMQKSRPSAE